jgi:hypothetical protein
MIKITEHLFSFPPFLITSWEHVSSLEGHPGNEDKVVITFHMTTGLSVELPEISKESSQAVFQALINYHEHKQLIKQRLKNAIANSLMNQSFSIDSLLNPQNPSPDSSFMAIPFQIIGDMPNPTVNPSDFSLNHLTNNLRHNPQMKDLPVLPRELLKKIAQTARDLFNEKSSLELPAAHTGCHCMHCQIARAIQIGMEQADVEVQPSDLRFSQWHIHLLSNEHFLVVSTNDPSECFDVKLKPQIECSCAMPTCPHIEAVLRS